MPEPASASPGRLHLPEGIRYACNQEGDCCRDAWEIRVEAQAVERILGLDWRACSRLEPSADSPFLPARRQSATRQLRRVGDACNFLAPGNRCALHARHGFESKPAVCRRFPLRFVQAPDGVYAAFSFACSSVLGNTGEPASALRDEAERIRALDPDPDTVALPVRLDARTPLAWEEYRGIEAGLDAILAREDRPVGLCLTAGHVWLNLLRKLLRTVEFERRTRPDSPTPAEALRFYLERTRADGFRQAFEIAAKPAGNPVLKRMLLGTYLSFRNTLRPHQWRVTALARVLAENLRHWLRIGSLRLTPLSDRVPYRRFHPRPEHLAAPATQALLRRYFRHALFRKDLVCRTDLFWGYCSFLLTYGMVGHYAAGLECLGRPDPALALRLVEKYFVHHSGFNQTFLYHPGIAHLFQHVFERPHYGHTLAG